MGTTATQAVRVGARHVAVPPAHAGRAVVALSVRLVRRSALALSFGLFAWLVVEGLTFAKAYPDAAARAALTMWGKDPGIRMIAGPGTAVDTVGGFVVWDAGLYLILVLGAWALTTTTRLLRGDEDAGRADLLLAGAIRPRSALVLQLVVLLATGALIGAVIALALVVVGAQVAGAVLFGASTAGYIAAVVGLSALACQVFDTRGAALRAAGAGLVAWVLLRMVSNSTDSREWIGWLTPAGWTDQVRSFGANRWPVLAVPLVVSAALVWSATLVRGHRDTGGALLAGTDVRRSHRWGLTSPAAFAWRANLGGLVAWAVGVGVAALVIGAMLPAVEEYLASDATFNDILAAMGMDVDDLTRGFVAMSAILLGLVVAVFAAFRTGAAWSEESSGRADQLLTRPVRRWQWLGGHVLGTVVSVVALCAVGAVSMWVGARATGGVLDVGDAFAAVFNGLPAVCVFAGTSVLVYGLAPRLTVPVGAAAAVTAYVVELVGPLLEWPRWVLDLSPFHHLAQVPVDPFATGPALVMVAIGAVLTVCGVAAFERRDLVGA